MGAVDFPPGSIFSVRVPINRFPHISPYLIIARVFGCGCVEAAKPQSIERSHEASKPRRVEAWRRRSREAGHFCEGSPDLLRQVANSLT